MTLPVWPEKFWGTPQAQFDPDETGYLGTDVGHKVATEDDFNYLDGVRGFCQAYQSHNINIAWAVFGNNRRIMPFNGEWGSTKGAHIQGDGITFDEEGLWYVTAKTRARSTGFGGGEPAAMDIIIRNSSGNELSRHTTDGLPDTGGMTFEGTVPVPVTTPGTRVVVETWSARWRWWDGGRRFSLLAAVKHDNRPGNIGQDTVPDEEE